MITLTEKVKKNLIVTSIFYFIASIIVLYLVKSGKYGGGPCNPGPDLISLFLLVVCIIGLLIRNLILTFLKDKQYLYSIFLDIVAIIVVVAILLTS